MLGAGNDREEVVAGELAGHAGEVGASVGEQDFRLREAGRRSAFSKKRQALKGLNRGIGLSLFFHGSGFTGGGEVKLASKASLALTGPGMQIRVASTGSQLTALWFVPPPVSARPA